MFSLWICVPISEEFAVRAEHDNLEKMLAAMLKMEPTCREQFRKNKVSSKISF
jgi:hypothetical protein